MPKITIEYTNNIDTDAFNMDSMVDDIHTVLGNCDTVAPERVMTFTHCADYYSVTNRDAHNGALVLNLQILENRTLNQKQDLGRACAMTAQKYVDAYKGKINIGVTCYITDIAPSMVIRGDGSSLN